MNNLSRPGMIGATLISVILAVAGVGSAAIASPAGASPAARAAAQVPVNVYNYDSENYCLSHKASAVRCEHNEKWLFVLRDSAMNSYWMVAADGTNNRCLQRAAGTDHLDVVTCTWNINQSWIPYAGNRYNMLVNQSSWTTSWQCLDMNHYDWDVPNGIITVTTCNTDTFEQWWRWY